MMEDKRLKDVLDFRSKCTFLIQNFEKLKTNNSHADEFLTKEIKTVLKVVRETAFAEGGYVESMVGETDSYTKKKE